MRAILGRLSDLGLKELFKLLTSVRAEGALEVETPAGRSTLDVKDGHVAGALAAPLVAAFASRTGTFCFRPGLPEGTAEWLPMEEFLARLDAAARAIAVPAAARLEPVPAAASGDPLAELRESLAEVPLPVGGTRVGVVTADPRPYRALESDWRQRGWDVIVLTDPDWPTGPSPNLLIVHLPSSGTLAGQGDAWLQLVRLAASRKPRIPVLWVGGLTDPWLRHEAILAGADFLLPAPAGDLGETARWFRDELSLLAERLVARSGPGDEEEAEAFRDFFLALHGDAAPAEVRASLLRFASTYFSRGALLAVRDAAFESLGGYGFSSVLPARLPRGVGVLEELVVERRPLRLDECDPAEAGALAAALAVQDGWRHAELFPVFSREDCVALFLGDGPVVHDGGSEGLAALLARSGGMIGV